MGEEPDFEALKKRAAESRQSGEDGKLGLRRSAGRKGTAAAKLEPLTDLSRISFQEPAADVGTPADQVTVVAKRVKGWKGTGFAKRDVLQIDEDDVSTDTSDGVHVPRRVQGRKGTGFVTRNELPIDDSDSSTESGESAPTCI